MKAGWFIAALLICAPTWATICATQAHSQRKTSDEDAAEKAAFETVCGACHPVSMASDLRSEPDWRATVEEMVKAGAKGTDEQFDLLLRYLLRNLTRVNVNAATAAEIRPVLAVSEATAQAIVKYRTDKGSFRTIEELKKIPGVDAATIEARKERIAF